MRIALVVKPGEQQTGIGRYSGELARALLSLGHEVTLVHPVVPLPGWLVRWVRRRLGWDLQAFFSTYPIWARYPRDVDLYHLSSQSLATLLFFCPPPGKTVITVHDIIPLLVKDDPQVTVYRNSFHVLFDHISIRGLHRAERLLAVSAHTRDTLISKLKVKPEQVVVVLEGVM